MKKLITVLLSMLFLMFTFCCCDNNATDNTTQKNTTTAISKYADNKYYEKAIETLENNIPKLNDKQANDIFDVFMKCNIVNDNLNYVFDENDSYKIWFGIESYNMYLNKDMTVSKITSYDDTAIYENGKVVETITIATTTIKTRAESTEKITQETTIENTGSESVYITDTGEKYHTKNCRYIKNGNKKEVSLSYAKENGYTPCSACH